MSISSEGMTAYAVAPVIYSTPSEFGIPEGCTDLLAWNVKHKELVEFVSNLNPGSRYRAVFVELKDGK